MSLFLSLASGRSHSSGQLLRSASHRLAAKVILAASLTAPVAAFAAPQSQNPPAPTEPGGLADTPVVIEELGLSIYPPIGSALSKERGPDGQPTVTIADASTTPAWQIRIQALVPELANPTPQLLIQDHVAKLKESGQNLTVLSSKEVTISGAQGWQAFLTDEKADVPLVNGYLIIPGQGPPFIVISFLCTLVDFAHMRGTLEECFASVMIDSPQRISDEREGKLKAGAALLESFDAVTLKKLVGLDQWFRHYRPATAGEGGEEVEIGVSHIIVREGKLSELNLEHKPSKNEREDGLLLTVQGRVILDSERELYYDTLAIYWMSWNNATEAWSIVAARKQKTNSISEAETGFRLAKSPGEPHGVLHVVKSGVEGANRDPKEWALPDYYMSQPAAWLLGHLMAKTSAPSGDYSFYAYDSSAGSLSLRQDSWLPAAGNNGGTLTSRFNTQAPPVTAEFDRDGKLVRRTRPDGSVSVPVSIADIRRIWLAKGLQLGSDS